MRKTMKKLTQGATRLLVLVLGLGLTATGWAATLSSSGYISKDSANPTAVFSGVRLSDIGTKYVLAGKMGGKWVSTKEAAGVYNASSDGTTLTVQFQKVDGDSDKYVKCVIVKFTEATVNDVNTIYAYAHATGNSATLVLGQDFSSATGTPSTGDSVDGYGMFDLSLTAGKKFEFKTTGTGTTYTTSGGNAAKAFWTLKVPTSSSLAEGTLVKLTDVRIGSRTDSWNATYDSAYMCVTNVNNEGIYSSLVSAYVPNLKVLWGDTACNVLQYKFPDSTPVMVNAGSASGVVFYKEDKTYGANGNDPGGCHVLQSGENVPYALNMNPYIGNSYTWRPLQEVEVLVVATATASADSNWSALAWSNGAADWTAAGSTPVLVTVTENCTITLDSAVSLESVIFDITPGKTLTLAGSNNLTAANGIVVKGGTISMTSSLLRGTVYGNGTIYYNGVRPTTSGTDVVLTDSDWRGTVRITYNYANIASGGARELFPQYWGSANSKIKWNGVCGYFGNKTSAAGWILEDLTIDANTYPALKKNDGGSNNLTTAPSLEGDGEFYDASNPKERFKFTSGSSFTGKITIASSAGNGMNVQFGATAVDTAARCIHILSGATVTVAANKTWAAPGGIIVNGTLNVGAGATIPAIAAGSTGAIIAPSGTATISGVQGNAISAGLGMVGGNIVVSGATGITELTIPADATQATQTFFAQNGNKLDLSACSSLVTLKLVLGNSTTFDLGNVILPASCTTVKYVVAAGSLRDLSAYTAPTGLGSLTWDFPMTETREEYAKGTFSVANVPANATVTVTRYDGTSATATVTDGAARLADYGTVRVTGAACWHAYEFNNNWTDSVSTGAHDCKTWNSDEPNFAEDPDKEGNYFVYTSIRPGPTDTKTAYSYPTEWSVAIRCTVPQTANGIIVCFGKVTNSAGLNQYIALVSGDTAGKVKLVHGAGGGAAQTIAEMTVANPTTSQHVYVFTKTATTVTVYCDGDLITSKAVSDSPYHAFQFGSMYGGMQSGSGLSAVTDKTTGGMVDYTRLYDFAISDDMIQKLAQDDPYDSSTPTYSRTMDDDAWWHTVDGTWLKSDDSTLVGVPDVAGIVDLKATADATMTVNLPAAPVYEKLTFQGAGAVTLVKNGNSPKIATAKLVVKTNVTAPYDIADFSGARVSVDAGKVLTFDFSTYPLESVTGVTTQQVTGVTTRADDRYAVVASAKSAWNSNLSLVYDPVEYVYSVVIDPAALVTKNNTTVAYPTVAAALTALSTDAGAVRLLVDYDQDITLSAGQTLDVGSTTYSGTVSVTGTNVEMVQNGTTYAAVDNSSNTWKGTVASGDWNTAANWVNGVKPNSYTAVTFPEGTYTVSITGHNDSDEYTAKCASMQLDGNVTFQRIANGAWTYVLIGGNITGSGTMTLEQVGIKSTADVRIDCPVVSNATANDNFFSSGTFTFNNTVNVAAGEFKAEYADLVFGALVTLANGGYVKANGLGSTATFNGGISVPENAAASLTVDSGTHTIASTVTLASGATLTVPTASTTVSGATFATSVADSYVKETAVDATTVYSVAAKRTVAVSTDAHSSVSGVTDGQKFVPGDVLTITASADTYYTPALTINGVAQTSPYQLTTTDADVTVSVTAARDTVTITIPPVVNTTVSVSYTSGGAAQVATAAGDITVDAGTDVTANWTAASGYKITSGASQALNAVTSAQTLASPIVEAMGATVSDVNFSYGADYATATVTATVSGDATSATLSYGNATYNTNVVNGTVTFENVAVTRGNDIYAEADYTITAKDGETDVTTTGGTGSTVAADVVNADWINERAASATGTSPSAQGAGGAWTNAVTYTDGTAAISDNRFAATTASTASRVVLAFEVCFSSASEETVSGEAQAAIKLGEDDSVTTFKILTTGNTWTSVSNAELPIDPSETYNVVLTIDYGTSTYKVDVEGKSLTNSTGSASFSLAKSSASVQNIDFAGSGTLTSLKGSQFEGYMVKDALNNFYATIQAATQAYNSANGPYTVLHSGTAPSGWKIDGNTLIKLAKGFFFMAY